MLKGFHHAGNDIWWPVSELFALAVAAPIHSPFCSCSRLEGFSIGAAAIEEDLIDYLVPRYRSEGRAKLAETLESRSPAARSDFVDWLREVGRLLSDEEKKCLVDDMTAILSSMRSAAAGSQFACL